MEYFQSLLLQIFFCLFSSFFSFKYGTSVYSSLYFIWFISYLQSYTLSLLHPMICLPKKIIPSLLEMCFGCCFWYLLLWIPLGTTFLCLLASTWNPFRLSLVHTRSKKGATDLENSYWWFLGTVAATSLCDLLVSFLPST